MNQDSTQYLTQEKLDALIKEQETIIKEQVPTIAKRIDDARQMGDLSENAEYHAAREEMAWAKGRLEEIKHILQNAELISAGGSSDTVQVGSHIEVDVAGNTRAYTIVGAQEANPAEGKISNESPLGEAFLGKKVGDEVEVTIPAGVQTYTIKSIS